LDHILELITLRHRTQMGIHLSVSMDERQVSPWELAREAGVSEFYVLYRMVSGKSWEDIQYLLLVLDRFEQRERVEEPKTRKVRLRLSDEESARFLELCGSETPDDVIARLWQEHKRRLNGGSHSQH
jgi:hypothetical protein